MAWKQAPIYSREKPKMESLLWGGVARRLQFVVDILHTGMMMPIGLTESFITFVSFVIILTVIDFKRNMSDTCFSFLRKLFTL